MGSPHGQAPHQSDSKPAWRAGQGSWGFPGHNGHVHLPELKINHRASRSSLLTTPASLLPARPLRLLASPRRPPQEQVQLGGQGLSLWSQVAWVSPLDLIPLWLLPQRSGGNGSSPDLTGLLKHPKHWRRVWASCPCSVNISPIPTALSLPH